jgi:hypothetical protein
MGVPLVEAQDLGDMKAGIHAGHDRQLFGGWERQVPLVECLAVRLVVL